MSLDATIGLFTLDEEIGRGAMARVFSARHKSDGTPVALKVLLPDIASQTQFSEAFAFEVRAAARLDHPRITAVFDHGFVTEAEQVEQLLPAGSPWLAMELVNGGTVSPLRGQVSWSQLRALLLDLLDALAHAHARGILHRDIKPGNVLLAEDTGRIRLTDFGLAHTIQREEDGLLSEEADIAGTPAFMAPEQIEAKWREFGPWTDLYAVGAMAWTLATGHPPYGGDMTQTFTGHLIGELPEFEPANKMPIGLVDWLGGMLALRPNRRFRRAADAAWALSKLDDIAEEEVLYTDKVDPTELATIVIAAEESTLFLPDAVCTTVDEEMVDLGPSAANIRPPVPVTWRGPRRARRHLHGAGLALFGQRALGLVGREKERDRLWAILHAAITHRRPQMVIIEGPVGCGKSTLANWFGERSDEVGASQAIVASHSQSGGANQGLGPMMARHFRLAGLDRRAAVDRVAGRLRRLGIQNDEETIALTEMAMPSSDEEIQSSGLGMRFSGAQERHTLLTRYLNLESCQRPVILWIDDALDGPDALAFAAQLLQQDHDAPVVVVATVASEERARCPEAAAILDELVARPRVSRLFLEPLGREEQSAMVREILGLEPELAAQVESRSAGNPLFAVQLVGDWVERGLLVTGPNGFRLAEGADARLPASLFEVWDERLQGVLAGHPLVAVQALELAAVLGQDVARHEWAEGCRRAELTVPEELMAEMMRLRLVVPTDDQGNWSFVHGMLREAIIEGAIEASRREKWSSVCADVLADRPEEVARRARYLMDAGRVEEAPEILKDAVLHEQRWGENARAQQLLALYEQALAVVNVPADDERQLVFQILEAAQQHTTGQIEKATETARRLYPMVGNCSDPDTAVLLLHTSAKVLAAAGELEEARRQLNEAVEICREHQLLRRYAVLAGALSFVHLRLGELDDAKRVSREAVFVGEAVGDPISVAKGYSMLSRIYWQAGDREPAKFFVEEARLRFERAGSRYGLAEIWNIKGELLRSTGDLRGAEEAYKQASARFAACGSGAWVFCDLNIGLTMAEAGNHAEALRIWEKVQQDLTDRGRMGIVVAVRVTRLVSLAATRQWEEMKKELDLAELGLAEKGIIDVDIGRCARRAAQLCDDAGQAELARRAWTIALGQWTAMSREEEAAEAAAHLHH